MAVEFVSLIFETSAKSRPAGMLVSGEKFARFTEINKSRIARV
jgi:hypothetical protein